MKKIYRCGGLTRTLCAVKKTGKTCVGRTGWGDLVKVYKHLPDEYIEGSYGDMGFCSAADRACAKHGGVWSE